MCDPVSIGAIALSAGGAAYNRKVQNDQIKAVNEQNRLAEEQSNLIREQEARRQERLTEQRMAELANTVSEVDPGAVRAAREAAGVENLEETVASRFATGAPDWMTGIGRPGGRDATVAAVNKVIDDNKEVLEAGANLRAGSGALGDVGLALARGFATQDVLGDTMAGSLTASERGMNTTPGQVMPKQTFIGDALQIGGNALAGAGGYYAGRRNPTSTSFLPGFTFLGAR